MSGYRPMRFPLPGIFAFVTLLWLAYAVVVGLVLTGIAVWGTVSLSVWDNAVQVALWFAFGFTAWLLYTYLPVYVANGITRREFTARVAGFVGVLAAVLAVLTAAGYLAEGGVYALAGWPQMLAPQRYFTAATEVPTVLLTQFLAFGAFSAVGALVGSSFYRDPALGLGSLPVGLAVLYLANIVSGTWVAASVGLSPFDRLPLAVAAPAGVALIALVLGGVWLLLRNIPIRPVST
ncbi:MULTISPECIES: hypothetical protein [unclassified Crossiella]|uniref:hypothetical protein n=1 Tax=unclassified Crossiella TaxID=2620835 RepID=UPI001FFECC5E|nr:MULTISPECIES: hypothetical protein [unclassified Crossiella]MCK2239182.1 hypothetical protein [Crossiella sp. S99.2]MCK2251249.1 hypothetical protein [Crossiella sp. S99.1]